ncbi:hypothetical protein GJ688_17855 [Heliobacillus mobilis]|uniref:YolD-like protein n=2 Tax=Heliobacterium TaxID=2697 RepID=A0A6I3SPI9_HELMO|nr:MULTISPECIES: hypothetical protein [Heliobacterium]MBC9785519.1 hypothetical protein [Heliobacterium chlorum]MTV50799.1 hypothetical protein [Heliobacterium mobile]
MNPKVQRFYASNSLWRPMLLPEHRDVTRITQREWLSNEEPIPELNDIRAEEIARVIELAASEQYEIKFRIKSGQWINGIPIKSKSGKLTIVSDGNEREIRCSDIVDVRE